MSITYQEIQKVKSLLQSTNSRHRKQGMKFLSESSPTSGEFCYNIRLLFGHNFDLNRIQHIMLEGQLDKIIMQNYPVYAYRKEIAMWMMLECAKYHGFSDQVKDMTEISFHGEDKHFELPPEISRLYNLERIYIDHAKGITLPESIKDLKLKIFSARSCEIEEFPSVLFEIPTLEEIKLSKNKLVTTDEDIETDHKDIKEDYFSIKTDKPTKLGFHSLGNLKFLDLQGNYFTKFPTSCTDLKNIKFLDIHDQHFLNEDIPQEMKDRYGLRIIY